MVKKKGQKSVTDRHQRQQGSSGVSQCLCVHVSVRMSVPLAQKNHESNPSVAVHQQDTTQFKMAATAADWGEKHTNS